jgi:hypothetical protein
LEEIRGTSEEVHGKSGKGPWEERKRSMEILEELYGKIRRGLREIGRDPWED